MSVRRLVSALSVCLVVASATVVVAQPKKNDPKAKAPVVPAKDAGSAAAAGSGSAAGSDAGSAVQMAEDPPPSDMEGTNENPDAPKTIGDTKEEPVPLPEKKQRSGYPVEEVWRPITLPANMSEVMLETHAQVSPFAGAASLRARYGITRQVQLGLTYLLGGLYDDPATLTKDKIGFHPGKAVGIDVTVLVQRWIAIRVGVPVYIDPVAVGLQLGAPMKFQFGEKFALGGLDDLLNIRITKFAPTFYQEATNAANAAAYDVDPNSILSRGQLRFSAYGVYQHKPNMALIGRLGMAFEDFSSQDPTTFIRAGLQFTPRKFLDAGFSLGFDDLAHVGSFAPAGFLAVRI